MAGLNRSHGLRLSDFPDNLSLHCVFVKLVNPDQ